MTVLCRVVGSCTSHGNPCALYGRSSLLSISHNSQRLATRDPVLRIK
jgi:hypothetical protein